MKETREEILNMIDFLKKSDKEQFSKECIINALEHILKYTEYDKMAIMKLL